MCQFSKSFFVLSAVLLIAAAAPLPAGAAGDDSEATFPLKGRHGIWIRGGMLNRITVDNTVTNGSVSTEARDHGTVGSLCYAYWVDQEWSIGLSANFLDAGASTSVTVGQVTSEAATVTSVLFGAHYCPAALSIGRSVKPFASASVGPYMGSATNSHVGPTVVENTSVSDSAVGLQVEVGADVFFATRFTAGVALGYDFVSAFDRQIGSHTNYSGPEFSLGLGFLLGAGR